MFTVETLHDLWKEKLTVQAGTISHSYLQENFQAYLNGYFSERFLSLDSFAILVSFYR